MRKLSEWPHQRKMGGYESNLGRHRGLWKKIADARIKLQAVDNHRASTAKTYYTPAAFPGQ